MKPRGLSVAAQLGLLGAMNTEKEREQNRAEVAFCNHARMAIHMQGRDPLDMEWGPELNEEGMKLVEIPSYAFTPRVEGSAELHLFGSKSAIRFLTEKHRCPNSHCDRVYAFWRAELHDDAMTIPMCPHCAQTVTRAQLEQFLQKSGWEKSSQGWHDTKGFGVAEELFRDNLRQVAFLVSTRMGLTSEAVLASCLGPLRALSPAEHVVVLASGLEHKQVVEAEAKWIASITAPRWAGIPSRSNGYGAFVEMRKLFPWSAVDSIVWRNHAMLRIPADYARQLDVRQSPRIMVGSPCGYSLRRIAGGGETNCACGATIERIECELGIQDGVPHEQVTLIAPHVPPISGQPENLPN